MGILSKNREKRIKWELPTAITSCLVFRLPARGGLVTEMGRVVMHWNRLAQEVVESPYLEVFKKQVAVARGDMLLAVNTTAITAGLWS